MDVENMLKFYFGIDYDDIKRNFGWVKKQIKYYAIEVIKTMNMKTIFKKHPNKLCIVSPLTRNEINNQVVTWQVLQTCMSVPDAEKALDYYVKENYGDVCVLSTFTEDYEHPPQLPANLVAQFYRVAYGLGS